MIKPFTLWYSMFSFDVKQYKHKKIYKLIYYILDKTEIWVRELSQTCPVCVHI